MLPPLRHGLGSGLITAVLLSLTGLVAPESYGARSDLRAEKFMVIDCLLPGQVRRLGSNRTYLTPRRPIKTTASDCEIRGGEYVEYDRANYATALKVWLPTAKEGDPQAQTNVGEIFEKGLGATADYAAAAAWYQKAAQQGYSRAMLNLGYLHEKGLGVAQDMREALNWYRRASGLTDDDLEFASSVQVTVAAKDRQIDALQRQSEANRQEIQALRSQLQEAQRGATEQQQELQATQKKLDAIRRQLQQQEQGAAGDAASALEQKRTRIDAEQAQLAARKKELEAFAAKLEQQAASLSSRQRSAAEQNADLEGKLLRAQADGDRLRRRLAAVKSELQAAHQDLRQGQGKDAGLIAQINSVEQERRELKLGLEASDKTIDMLRDSLAQAQRQLDGGGIEYAKAQGEFARRQDLYDAERNQLQAERDQLAKIASTMTKKSQQSLAEVSKLRDELKTQEQEYAEKLRLLNTKYMAHKARLEQTREKLKRIESRPQEVQLASVQAPTIELIEPPVSLTRGAYTATVLSEVDAREVIGRVTAPAGLMSFKVNEATHGVDDNGLFRFIVPVPGQRQSISLVAVDRQGQRVAFAFDLFRANAETRRTESVKDTGKKNQLRLDGLGKYHALVIGNQAYAHLPDLRTPITDAKAIAGLLENQYGYKTTLLVNASRYAILAKLNELRAELKENDNLLIYYAGHGEIDTTNGQGYWLPVDAQKKNTENWISTRSISDILNAMAAKHVIVVADSCYSGAMTRSSLARLQVGKTVDQWRTWFAKMANLRTRMVLSSGGEEPVNDGGGGKHSIFAKALLRVLEENKRCLDGYSLYNQVADYVIESNRRMDIKQTPAYAPIKFAGHESGEFLFQPL